MSDTSVPMVGGPVGFDPGTYGRSFADVYDSWYGDLTDPTATVAFIRRFGRSLALLELGVGSGRLAEPLSSAGHTVVGLDVSPEMLQRRRDREAFLALRADMSSLPFGPRSFDVVIIAYNTLFNLVDADAQRRCLMEAAKCLRPSGTVVVEAFVPPPADPARDRLVSTRSIDVDRVVLTATIRDDERQVITGQHIDITEGGIRLRPWRIRYAAPAELDTMAASAGLQLHERFSSWDAEPFDDSSDHHVSVYRRSDA